MLSVSWDTIRLFLHVLAATIWVGGQLTLAALVPALRRLGAEIPRAAARRFNQVAWPAFAVLVLTGVWNIIAVRSQIIGSPGSPGIRRLGRWWPGTCWRQRWWSPHTGWCRYRSGWPCTCWCSARPRTRC
jgi:hypothetical protein